MHLFLSINGKTEIPIKSIKEYTASELALLVIATKAKSIEKSELYSSFNLGAQTIRKAIYSLSKKGHVYMDWHTVYFMQQNTDTVEVSLKPAMLYFKKEITATELRVLYAMELLSQMHKQLNAKNISALLNMDRSEASKALISLNSKGLLTKHNNDSAAHHYYSLGSE